MLLTTRQITLNWLPTKEERSAIGQRQMPNGLGDHWMEALGTLYTPSPRPGVQFRSNEAMATTKCVRATLLKSDAPAPKPVFNALHLR